MDLVVFLMVRYVDSVDDVSTKTVVCCTRYAWQGNGVMVNSIYGLGSYWSRDVMEYYNFYSWYLRIILTQLCRFFTHTAWNWGRTIFEAVAAAIYWYPSARGNGGEVVCFWTEIAVLSLMSLYPVLIDIKTNVSTLKIFKLQNLSWSGYTHCVIVCNCLYRLTCRAKRVSWSVWIDPLL